MMAVLWDDIASDVAAAKRHWREAMLLHDRALADPADYVVGMAFQHAMQSGYTALEAGLRRLVAMLGEPMPAGPDWHAALVRRLARPLAGGRPALFPLPLSGHVEELRRFRHVAMHAYDDFSPRKATIPVEAAAIVVAEIDAVLAAFRAALDP